MVHWWDDRIQINFINPLNSSVVKSTFLLFFLFCNWLIEQGTPLQLVSISQSQKERITRISIVHLFIIYVTIRQSPTALLSFLILTQFTFCKFSSTYSSYCSYSFYSSYSTYFSSLLYSTVSPQSELDHECVWIMTFKVLPMDKTEYTIKTIPVNQPPSHFGKQITNTLLCSGLTGKW